MRHPDIEQKLTPAAKEALDELLEDYKSQILLGAEQSAATLTGELKEISVNDIITSVNRVGKPNPRRQQLERILEAYTIVGIIVGFSGVFVFFYREVLENLKSTDRLSLVVAFFGFLISGLSFLFLRARRAREVSRFEQLRTKEDRRIDYMIDFLRLWPQIELAIRKVVSSRLGESKARAPLSQLIVLLKEEQFLSVEDIASLKEILEVRNKAVHGTIDSDPTQIVNLTRRAERLLSTLSGVV